MIRMWYIFSRFWCRFYVNLIHYGRVYHRELVPPEGPLLFVSNHQSFFDPVLVGYGLEREVDYMARDTLFRNPFFGWLIRSLNAFPVRRGQADLTAIKETLRRLKQGRAVLLFPEGTRTLDGRISEFKPGLALLARKANVPIVPVVVDGAYEAWPRSSPAPRPFMPIHVAFGEPFWPKDFLKMDPEAFVREINRKLIRMQDEIRIKSGKSPYNYDNGARVPEKE